MHWKKINGKQYAYRSRRRGDRVTSECYGPAGPLAGLLVALDAMRQADQADQWAERQAEQADMDADRSEARQFDAEVATVQAEAAAYLQALGYHRVKRGPWRKRRCPKR